MPKTAVLFAAIVPPFCLVRPISTSGHPSPAISFPRLSTKQGLCQSENKLLSGSGSYEYLHIGSLWKCNGMCNFLRIDCLLPVNGAGSGGARPVAGSWRRIGDHGRLPSPSSCKGPLGLPCAVAPMGCGRAMRVFSSRCVLHGWPRGGITRTHPSLRLVRAAFLAAQRIPSAPFVRTAFMEARCRAAVSRRRELARVCAASASWDAVA